MKTLTKIVLAACVGVLSLNIGCLSKSDKESYNLYKLFKEVERTVVSSYADENNDGFISKDEKNKLMGKIAEKNNCKCEGNDFCDTYYFIDKNGKYKTDKEKLEMFQNYKQ